MTKVEGNSRKFPDFTMKFFHNTIILDNVKEIITRAVKTRWREYIHVMLKKVCLPEAKIEIAVSNASISIQFWHVSWSRKGAQNGSLQNTTIFKNKWSLSQCLFVKIQAL